jgi:FKBP-type peptidyl-prolyl cis-trans isomerase FkpA
MMQRTIFLNDKIIFKNLNHIDMKKLFIPLFLTVMIVILGSCMKEKSSSCTNYTLAQDKHVIDSFLTASGSSANYTYDSQEGVYYYISTPGTGNYPTGDSLVAFHYERRLLNGTLIDSATSNIASYSLNYYQNPLISYSLVKLKEGGKIYVILPSSSYFAFGCGGANNSAGQMVVPPYSELIYNFTLLDVKKQYQN